jgi:hypothetical protein
VAQVLAVVVVVILLMEEDLMAVLAGLMEAVVVVVVRHKLQLLALVEQVVLVALEFILGKERHEIRRN